jgi:propionyl-CoA carboxylase alpha chain
MTRFDTILVANRVEIARRVFRTARAMGLRTVAVFVEADASAPYVEDADDAVRIDSHLDGESIIAAAMATGAGAIHPGYGFLAENAEFATAVKAAGVVWVGPSADAIGAMGDKIAAKQLAIEAGVPVLHSTDDPEHFAAVGFPLLIKAAAGGGGKGMRVVDSVEALPEAVAAAEREAFSGFGDSRVFAERYVTRSRHIEIQILGDAHGGLIHLGERECSIQRRHQKVIEESPSPFLDAAMRADMTAAALRLASVLGYQSAGTVEFLVDDEKGEFFFLEVNTRLQVEHPVTEAVTGIDLVREQLRIAMGEALDHRQEDVTFNGHAVEARLYAEDPSNAFLPATGTLEAFEPAPEPQVRWDTGVRTGSVIGAEFDPMIAKVVASAPTRAEAASALALALERLHIGGVVTNRDFLAAVLRTEEFLDGDTTTDFIERVQPPPERDIDDDELGRLAVAGAMFVQAANHDAVEILGNVPSGFRIGRLPAERLELARGEELITVHYRSRRDGSFVLGVDGNEGQVHIHSCSGSHIDLEIDGRRRTLRAGRFGNHLHLTGPRGGVTFDLVPRFSIPVAEVPGGAVAAPMPGKVIELRVAVGDSVEAGQVVTILEAMKMENHLTAPHAGIVRQIRVAVGDQIEKDVLLMVIEEPGDGADTPTSAEPPQP